jgi:uncharacterized protein (DUF1684 family)
MAERIRLVQGDNLPYIKLALKNADGTPLDVSDATVVVKFRASGNTTTLSILSCSFVTDGTDGLIVFNFTGNTLDVPPGSYEGEIEIDFAGQIQTVYSTLKFLVREDFS